MFTPVGHLSSFESLEEELISARCRRNFDREGTKKRKGNRNCRWPHLARLPRHAALAKLRSVAVLAQGSFSEETPISYTCNDEPPITSRFMKWLTLDCLRCLSSATLLVGKILPGNIPGILSDIFTKEANLITEPRRGPKIGSNNQAPCSVFLGGDLEET